MRIKAIIRAAIAASLALAAFASAAAQDSSREQTIVPMKGGYFVAFSTTPEARGARGDGGWSTTLAEAELESNTIRRVFVDSGGTLYFGYALVIEPLAPARFKVSVRPLSAHDEEELRAKRVFKGRNIQASSAAGVSRPPAPQTVSDGDTFALDVLVNSKTGEKLTDFVTVSADESRLRQTAAGRGSAPRDFTLEDVEMKIVNYQLLVNGELIAGGKRSGAVAGPVVWFHVPGRGRFIFSLMPRAGYDFKKIGTVELDRIKFTLDGESYEWVSGVPVVGVGGPWNLYVLHDPTYVPDSFFLGVEGSAEKAERRDPSSSSSSAMSEVEKTLRKPKSVGTTGFGKSSEAKRDGEADKPARVRIIVGAANRVENLLPAGVGPFVQISARDAYTRWLYEDVAYIITPAESKAYKLLQTDAERERFIEQFWRARDPDPKTAENEFRREYYARVAYANEHFAFAGVPGWRSDRGRIYITHGPPDSVETLQSGERWFYNNLPGLGANVRFEFADATGKGDLRLSDKKP